jgi:hypothetical protein
MKIITIDFNLQNGAEVFDERGNTLFHTDKSSELVLFCLGLQTEDPRMTFRFGSSYHSGAAYEKGVADAKRLASK